MNNPPNKWYYIVHHDRSHDDNAEVYYTRYYVVYTGESANSDEAVRSFCLKTFGEEEVPSYGGRLITNWAAVWQPRPLTDLSYRNYWGEELVMQEYHI